MFSTTKQKCSKVASGIAAILFVLLPAATAAAADPEKPRSQPQGLDLATIRPEIQTGFAHAGWGYDRYKNMEKLDAGKRMTVADLKGPGVIRAIHTCRHQKEELSTRGVVLEIWFDDAKEPAVMCPLGDFFGDGCNGNSMFFTSKHIECAPWSYNAYFPMPFKERARVIFRNDTDQNLMNYSYVEWEKLPKWDDRLGYFHATYRRKCFQLTNKSDEMFFEIEGAGHLIGRQYSVVTDEPIFRGFSTVMEGNNEVDIDGRQRHIDYLGTEDSFTFSWGFQRTFAGLRAGMTLVEKAGPARLSIYRFHDHMPIRFSKSLKWHINWSQERMFTGRPEWPKAVADGGCWVDYATVYYWYQTTPGGFKHEPMRPVADRSKPMLRPPAKQADVGDAIGKLDVDPELRNEFSAKEDLRRVHIAGCWSGTHPFWIDRPKPTGGHPGNPNPGRQGILAVHPAGEHTPSLVMRKVSLPADKKSSLRLVVSGDPYEAPRRSDFLLQAGIHDGAKMQWFPQETIDAGAPPSEEDWRTLQYSLEDHAGKTVGIVVKTSYGGPKGLKMNEEAFFDEISVVDR